MRIGIEAERANLPNPTGVEQYAKQLILSFSEIDTENEYILYLRTQPEKWIKELPKNFKYKVIPFPVFWTQIRISLEMIFNPVDALLIMASALPLIHPKNSVVTIHDIAWEKYPETFGAFMLNYLRFSTWFACRFARKIIAVSEQTKRDLVKKYNLNENKVKVIYHGFDMQHEVKQAEVLAFEKPELINEEKKKILELPEKYILYIGTLQPRKNIIGLIDAYIQMKERAGDKQIPGLVIAGGKGWLYEEITKKIQDHPEVKYFGYVQDRFALLKKASVLVLPSFYEGFGMTILDAFAARVPVATSNISSMPEVANTAAEYFDPNNIESIIEALEKIVYDQKRADELITLGDQRLKEFSWKKCAQQTLEYITEK